MSLIDKSILVKLSVSMPGNSKKDAKLTDDTIRAHGMGIKSAKVLKLIFPEEAIDPLTELQGKIRDYNYTVTLPWQDDGYRILPMAIHEEYTQEIRKLRAEWDKAAAVFLDSMPKWEQWAQENHNGSFEPKLYDTAKVAKKFGLKIDFAPVPSGEDFRVAVDADTRQAVNERIAAAEEFARADLWQRLAAPLQRMVERCSAPDKVFRDSLTGNIAEIVSLIPKLNLSADPNLARLAAEAKALGEIKPQTLRTDQDARAKAAADAKALLDRMAGYMPAAPAE